MKICYVSLTYHVSKQLFLGNSLVELSEIDLLFTSLLVPYRHH